MTRPVDNGLTMWLLPLMAGAAGLSVIVLPMFAQAPTGKELVVASATSGFRIPTRPGDRVEPSHARAVKLEGAVLHNEAAAVDLCLDYVEAQFKYFRSKIADDGVPAFALKIRSSD